MTSSEILANVQKSKVPAFQKQVAPFLGIPGLLNTGQVLYPLSYWSVAEEQKEWVLHCLTT